MKIKRHKMPKVDDTAGRRMGKQAPLTTTIKITDEICRWGFSDVERRGQTEIYFNCSDFALFLALIASRAIHTNIYLV